MSGFGALSPLEFVPEVASSMLVGVCMCYLRHVGSGGLLCVRRHVAHAGLMIVMWMRAVDELAIHRHPHQVCADESDH